MRRDFAAIKWKEILENNSVKDCWDIIVSKLETLQKKHVVYNNLSSRKKPVWFNGDIKVLIAQKKKTWANYKRNPTTELKTVYRAVESELHQKIRAAKTCYENNIAANININPKAFFSYASTKNQSNKIDCLQNGQQKVTFDLEKADILNTAFASTFTIEDTRNIPNIENETLKLMEEFAINENVVETELKLLKANKAPGPDKIYARILKELGNEIVPILTKLFNKSLNEGIVPDAWKTANVIPIYKKGDKSDPLNYRPVSLTSSPCKMMESIIKKKT